MVLPIFRTASTILTFLSSTVTYATAIGPSADLHIVNRDIQPDGYWRSAVLAGATEDSASFPGPLIKGDKGDRFRLNVINSLTDEKMNTNTSIHWHGIFQRSSSWADGAALVTQCPILSGDSFLYEFTVPDQAGTYWYHSHLSTQYCDGLRGPLVVYDPQDPYRMLYDVDDESTIITLADWYHTPKPDPFPFPKRDSTLINGLGRYDESSESPLAVVVVKQGMRYRFRLISTNCDGDYIFSIDGHPFTIIEVDGVNTEKLVADSVSISTGQRYSLIVEANQTIGNYWIRAKRARKDTKMIDGIDMAILRYDNAPQTEPNMTEPCLTKQMLETDLHPLENPGAPGGAGQGEVDFPLNLIMTFHEGNSSYTINGASFIPPSIPVLLQILNGARFDEFMPPGSVYVLPRNKTVEISIPGGAKDSPHPFHLHGHTIDVVRSAGSREYNYKNPVRRDVVSTGDDTDNVTFRFTTDNPGPWFLHCHIDWHLEVGLAIVFVEDPYTIARNPPPPEWKNLCPTTKASPAQHPMSMLDTVLKYFSS